MISCSKFSFKTEFSIFESFSEGTVRMFKETIENRRVIFQKLLNLEEERKATNKRLAEWIKQAIENQQQCDVLQKTETIADRVKSKLQVDWSDKIFQKCVFRELERAGFKRLSFLSVILEEWDLSHLTGYLAILAQTGLALDRKTDEIQFYKDLFAQLDREKLIYFLTWAIAFGELDESVIEEIVPPFTDEDVRQIVESWGAKIVDENECPKCHIEPGMPSGKRRACFKCVKRSIQTLERIHIPSMWEETDGDARYLCECSSRVKGLVYANFILPGYDHKCDFHKRLVTKGVSEEEDSKSKTN